MSAAARLAIALVLGVAVWAVWLEPASLRQQTYRIALPRWPPELSGIRVAVVADLHVGSPFNQIDKLRRIVALTNEGGPDLVLLPGDFVIQGVRGGRFVPPEDIAAELAGLRAPLGVWATLGNHDWWYDGRRVRAALEASGVRVLEDEAVELHRGAASFWLLGVGDFWEGKHDVRKGLAGIPADATILAMTHNPDVFPDFPPTVALVVAGHTHGGQVWLPLVGRPVVPSKYGQRYAYGHVVEDGRHLFVSPGIGTSIVPVRFFVPPEISVLELVSETEGPAA